MAQHISVRVPWKDNGYNGFVCDKPCLNNACLRLANIALNRNDEREIELAGQVMSGHENELPCISEGATFMSPNSHKTVEIHPYKGKNNEGSHGHFMETDLIFPPFSFPARPFGWTMLNKGNDQKGDNITKLADMYSIDYKQNREPNLNFKTNWVQDAENQRAIFDGFYKSVLPRKSLVIPYAKQVPFSESATRIIMGVGFVDNIVPPPEHNRSKNEGLRSILWETMVGHSIRDDMKDGYLLPYREMMAYAEQHPEFDIDSITVTADNEYIWEFSFATEHVSYDATISVLLQCIKALEIIKDCIPGNWNECIEWTKARLSEVWKDRGAFPGAGMMLYTMGFNSGLLIAEEIKKSLSDGESFVNKLMSALVEPDKHLSRDIIATINKTVLNAFNGLSSERKKMFWLLSRMSLTEKQANVLFNGGFNIIDKKGNRKFIQVDIGCTDAQILENPYLLYERMRLLDEEMQIPVRSVDMAVYPSDEIKNNDPLPEPTRVDSDNDERRLRALAVSVLERQANNGHTIYPMYGLVKAINELPLDPGCIVTNDIINGVLSFFKSEIIADEMKDGSLALQLDRMQQIDDVIRSSVIKRVESENRHVINSDWVQIVSNAFKTSELTESEKLARQEKVAILKELAEARFSVLTGGAGTGKTTLLALLCQSEKISDGRVLLLAPTGKARVRMSQAMRQRDIKAEALTVAQFLLRNGRYDTYTGRYRLSYTSADDVPQTVIIDECSMLTEEMFGALMQALKPAIRIIMVGDPKQLPPIGAGRPFVDLVNYLKNDGLPDFPRVCKSYGELTITRRQQNENGTDRDDTILSEWYAGTDLELDSDIYARLQSGKCGENISLKTWSTADDLEELIFETICEETDMKNVDDIDGFDLSIGGKVNGEWMNFGDYPEKIENWQVLSAYRNNPIMGSATINRYIHERYRSKHTTAISSYRKKTTRKALGTDGILYGDKVINIRNQKKDGFPKEDCHNFVANGEVGIVEQLWHQKKPYKHLIRFSSQPNHNYNWYSTSNDDKAVYMELAYALTIHKSQGSEFDKVILVIGEPSGMLSREMLYTALTRQKKKLVILYNTDVYHLMNYSSMEHSDIARRFTNLFEKPEIIEFKGGLYESNLIHKTARGELVRSKSEVIVADSLFYAGIDYKYEKELDLGEDGRRSPDFTIDDPESGTVYYWEHCGMMSNADYRRRWEAKKELYEKHGIIEGKNLIISYDKPDKSINSQEIKELINKFLK